MGFFKLPLVFVTVLVLYCTVLEVNSLKCYVCKNCAKVTSDQLKTCEIPQMNTTTTTLRPSSSSSSSSSSTSTSSTESSSSSSSSTESSSSSSTESSSSSSSSSTESSSSSSTESSSSSSSTPSSSTESSSSSSSTPSSSTESSSSSSSTPSSSTESSSSSSSTPSSSTESSSSSSSTPSSSTESSSSSSTESSSSSSSTESSSSSSSSSSVNPEEYRVIRVERSAEFNNLEETALESDECSCEDGYCNCGGKAFFSPYADSLANITVTFVCIKETITSNSTTTVNRGCGVEFNTTATTCRYSGYDETCKVCKQDSCNSAFSVSFSLFALVPAVLMYLV